MPLDPPRRRTEPRRRTPADARTDGVGAPASPLARVPEAEFVAVFLAGEMRSSRFGAGLRELLHEAGHDSALVLTPDTADERANAQRRDLLSRFRGWPDREVFDGLPRDTAWSRSEIPPESVLAAHYMDYSYWHELSGGTRRVADGVRRVRAGVTAFGVSNEPFRAVARDIERGCAVHPLVLVGTHPDGPLTVLEGHLRATALGLARADTRPRAVPVLLGLSPRMAEWSRLPPGP